MRNSRRGALEEADAPKAAPKTNDTSSSCCVASFTSVAAAAADPSEHRRATPFTLPSIHKGVTPPPATISLPRALLSLDQSCARMECADPVDEQRDSRCGSPLSCSTSSTRDLSTHAADDAVLLGQLSEAERRSRRRVTASEARHRSHLARTALHAGDGSPTLPSRGDGEERGGDLPELDGWLVDNTHTQSLVSAGKYVEAYFVVSAALSRYGKSEVRRCVLRARRAECSYALLNYKECVGDCRAVLGMLEGEARRRPASPRAPLEESRAAKERPVDVLKVVRLCAKAHVMREEYLEAQAMYHYLLDSPPDSIAALLVPTLPVVERTLLLRERECLPAVSQFRQCVSQELWQSALKALAHARPLVEDTPLRVLEAMTLLEADDVDAAREALLPYLPTVPAPPPAPSPAPSPSPSSKEAAAAAVFGEDQEGSSMGSAAERKLLRCNVDAHYLLTTALLAKVSAYSGRVYMNIAAVLLQRCLHLSPSYAPAISLGNYLVKLEDAFSLADTCARKGDRQRAVRVLTEALTFDPANKRIMAVLYLHRADVYLSLGRPLLTIEDCTSSLLNDPTTGVTAGRAFLLRARAYQQTHRNTEAASDIVMAVRLNPNLASQVDPAGPLPTQPAQEEDEQRRAFRPFAGPSSRHGLASAQSRRPHSPSSKAWPPPRGRNATRPFPSKSNPPPPLPRTFRSSSYTQRQRQQPPPSSRSLPMPSAAERTSAPTLYDVLEVPQKSSLAQIRQSFKRLTLQYHPDRLVNEPEEVQLHAVEMFKKINNAHGVLTDEARRRAYDATLLSSP